MAAQNPLWFLLNLYGWAIMAMSVITAFITEWWWVILMGIIGYLIALLADLIGGGSLGRTGRVRLARIDQENRELRAEQARLLGALKERDERLALMQKAANPPPPAAS